MGVHVSIRSGDSASLASPALLPTLLGCCSAGVVGKNYTFDPGANISASLGSGIGVDAAYALSRQTGGRINFMPCTPSWSAAPSVTHSGTGPTVTCALTAGAPGTYDDHTIVGTVAIGGAGGSGAAIDMAYDGTTIIERLPIPAENPAVLTGKVDIQYGAVLTGYVANTLTPLHLDFTAPTADVVTFGAGTLTASAAGLRAAFATSVAVQTWTSADLLDAGEAVILANARKLLITTTGGTPGDAPADCLITGTRYGVAVSETLTIGQVLNDIVSSVNEYTVITSIVFGAGGGNGGLITLGYSSAYATPAEIVADFNTAATAAGLAVQARADESSTGAVYLQLYSTSAGAGVTETIDAGASTADTPLGFTAAAPSNLTATGSAATIALPHTGLTLTFPTGTYVKSDTYTMVCTGPRATVGALVTGAQAARAKYKQAPFGFFVVCQPASTAGNAAAIQAALASVNAEAIGDASNPTFITSIVGSPFFATSTTKATNDTNIGAADAALLLSFGAVAANNDSIATCDVYLPGSTDLRYGFFRRTAALSWAAKRASAAKLAADVADGICPEASLLAPDLLTYARDDSTATTKLGGGSGPGFSALKSTSNGLSEVKFSPGATRAGPTSRLRYVGVYGVCLEVARLIHPFVERWEGQTDQVDPTTGMLSDEAKKTRQGDIDAVIRPTLLPSESAPNCSDFTVELLDPLVGKFIDNGQIRIEVRIVPLGEIEEVYVAIIATGQGTEIVG